MVTLTVQWGGQPPPFISPQGAAVFCDNEDIVTGGQICSDVHVVGTAQIIYKGNKAGIATISYIPGIGVHNYTVDFTRGYAVSNTVALTVTGKYPTTTTISSSGAAGNYTLTGSVLGNDLGTLPPSGKVSFLDTTNSNFNLGLATLGNPIYFLGTSVPSFIGPSQPNGPILDIAFADFNGDGILDAAVLYSTQGPNTIALFEGLPGGGYQQQFPPIQAPFATKLAVGDLDSNGLPDIVTVTTPPSPFPIISYLNTGGWNFVEADSQALGGPGAIGPFILGDFNLDGNLDIMALGVPQGIPAVAPPYVFAYAGKGDGTFIFNSQNPTTFNPNGPSNNPIAIAAGNFNGYIIPGFAVLCAGDKTVRIYTVSPFGGPNITAFSDPFNDFYQTGGNPTGLAVADFNGDGFPDFAVINSPQNDLVVYLNQDDAVLNPFIQNTQFSLQSISPTGTKPDFITWGDFNGDGIADLAVANFTSNTVSLLQGDGAGNFIPENPITLGAGSNPVLLRTADLNGDNNTDLVVVGQNNNPFASIYFLQPFWEVTGTLTGVSPDGSGTHKVLASYAGDTNYTGSQSATKSLTAKLQTTTLTLTPSPATTTYLQQVALTAKLTPFSGQGHTTNGETVTFYDGGTNLGTKTLTTGQATLNINTLNAGNHFLRAVYAGDSNFAAATSTPSVKFVVGQIASSTKLTLASGSPHVGYSDLLTATVTNFGGPTETVTFAANGTTLCVVALGAAGKATCSWTPTSTAPVTLTATYAGDTNYEASVGSQTVTPTYALDPLISLNLGSQAVYYPGATQVTICVSPSASATPTGTVQLLNNGSLLKTLTLGGNGCANWYITPALAAGTYHLQAVYLGDSKNKPGISSTINFVVNKALTNLSSSCWDGTFPYGKNFNCSVSMASTGGTVPGSVDYKVDNGATKSVALTGGDGSFVIVRPIVGSHTVTIWYPGSTNFAATPPTIEDFTVTPAPVDILLTPSSWNASHAAGVTFTASVSSWSAGPPNGIGTITFYDGSTLLGTKQVNANGAAALFTKNLQFGENTITATYIGANYQSKTVNISLWVGP